MKKEKSIYLTAFLFGVVGTNILASKEWINTACLHRHQLLQLSYSEIHYESYLVELLLLRFKTIMILGLLGKVISARWVHHLFGGIISVMFGIVLTCSILANGVWGVLLFLAILFPQWILYVGAYMFWGDFNERKFTGWENKRKPIRVVLLVLFVVSGCMTEAYINPVVLKMIIR